MKINIVGLLKQAQRHLKILDDLQVSHPEIMQADVQTRFEVVSASMILDELIKNIEIVQGDQTQLETFLQTYSLKREWTQEEYIKACQNRKCPCGEMHWTKCDGECGWNAAIANPDLNF